MKPTLTILIEGYAHPNEDGSYTASPTTSLLRFNGKNYIIDPGCNEKLLLEKMAEYSLKVEDITAIFLTHYHLDHVLNIRLFPSTPIYDGNMQWDQDKEIFYTDYWLIPEFKLLATPGHAGEQFSLLIDTENLGLACIVQDVFWWEDGKQTSNTVEELLASKDPFMSDHAALLESRKKVLESGAKWIIPGHGKLFKNPL
ncbi:MBL fold metallo-hydrolase [bacterium]|nr:MBL fold metallo-hydrolase [bacterium]